MLFTIEFDRSKFLHFTLECNILFLKITKYTLKKCRNKTQTKQLIAEVFSNT